MCTLQQAGLQGGVFLESSVLENSLNAHSNHDNITLDDILAHTIAHVLSLPFLLPPPTHANVHTDCLSNTKIRNLGYPFRKKILKTHPSPS